MNRLILKEALHRQDVALHTHSLSLAEQLLIVLLLLLLDLWIIILLIVGPHTGVAVLGIVGVLTLLVLLEGEQRVQEKLLLLFVLVILGFLDLLLLFEHRLLLGHLSDLPLIFQVLVILAIIAVIWVLTSLPPLSNQIVVQHEVVVALVHPLLPLKLDEGLGFAFLLLSLAILDHLVLFLLVQVVIDFLGHAINMGDTLVLRNVGKAGDVAIIDVCSWTEVVHASTVIGLVWVDHLVL